MRRGIVTIITLLAGAGCQDSSTNTGSADAGFISGIQFRDTSPPGDAPDSAAEVRAPAGPQDVPPPQPDLPPTPCAAEGSACDDGNPCTVNDQCSGGLCQGSAITCDDGLQCTDDYCAEGSCQHPVAAGSCLIDGQCYSEAAPNPANSCQRCDSGAAPTLWSSTDGTCEDGDPCTGPDICTAAGCVAGPPLDADMDGVVSASCGGTDCDDGSKAVAPGKVELCTDNLDNDCNGLTDSADPNCGGSAETCAYHVDCHPDAVCALHSKTSQKVCSKQCAGSADCLPTETCTKLPGSAHVGFCQPALGPKSAGEGCNLPNECQSGLCVSNLCMDGCLNDLHCTKPQHTCGWLGSEQTGLYGVCIPNQQGLIVNGQPCTTDGQSYSGDFCMSGVCDLTAANAAFWTCSPLCTSESACAPSQECNLVTYVPSSNPLFIPYHPQFTQPLHDAVAGCYTVAAAGFKQDGMACSANQECTSNKCLPVVPGDPTSYCTSFCAYDAECAPGLNCVLEAFLLTSDWLADPNNGSQAPSTSRTLVQVCKP